MKFAKQNASRYGRRGGLASAAKKSSKNAQKIAENRRTAEEKAFSDFEKAQSGYFNGFDFTSIFHEKVKKSDAILISESDDRSMCEGVNVGADGIVVYFFAEPAKVTKIVCFNRSAYCF